MIIIMGMPGAGKTVQSQLVQDKLGFHWLSTGQILRESGDPEVLAVQKSGALVDDKTIVRVVGERLKKEGYDKTFLLDGIPRNTYQAKWLIEHVDEVGKHVMGILFLDVDVDVANERLGSRGRPDDTAAALAKRHEEQKKLEPMLEYLKTHDIPVEYIDANGTVEETFESVKQVLSKYVDLEI